MSRQPTPLLDLQDALFTNPAPAPASLRPATPTQTGHPQPPRRDKEWNATTPCAPTCIACGMPEPPADTPAWPLCPATRSRHATLCEHTSDAYKADVCITTTHVHAVLMTLPNTGRTIAAVECPHCGQQHPHDPKPGRHYRSSRCRTARKPYIVDVPEVTAP